MAIVGVGIDVVDLSRFEDSLRRTPGLAERLFTLAEASRPPASLAARFADEFNSGMPDGLAARYANFRRICEQSGRDPAGVRLSTTLPVCCDRTRGEAARRAAELHAAGADTSTSTCTTSRT